VTVNPTCQEALDAAFPPMADAEIVRAVSEGILLADDLITGTLFLKNPIGRNIRGLLRRAGVMYRIHDLCELGDLPFRSAMVKMERGSWHCLEISSGSFKAHVCRTDGPNSLPDDSETRQDERLANQLDLFAGSVVPFSKLLTSVGRKYALLTFGTDKKGSLHHVCWGMPPTDGDDWLAHTNVLRRMAVSSTVVDPVKPDKKAALRFLKHVEESLSKKDDESQSS
jgi:hypothetical protein